MTDITHILSKLENGDASSTEELLPLVYGELKRLAAARLANEKAGQTLQATALVHEAWLRLTGGSSPEKWNSRGHFFSAAAEAMRRILINRARDKQRQKRGGGRRRIELDEIQLALDTPSDQLLALDEAMQHLATEDSDSAQLVNLRFFGGLSHGEAAEAMGISRRTADRYWAYARAWLVTELDETAE